MSTDRNANYRSADAAAAALPVDDAAMHIDPRVLETLGRWRHVDSHSLNSLASALTTKAGESAATNSHYLSALHGFVAEQITADHLGVVLPTQTGIAAWDLYYNGQAVQIKEGTSAYELVHHALDRYPNIRTFATDPATAERLQAEGINAIPIPGVEPDHVAELTAHSVTGLTALEKAGAISFPLITAAVSICRYWERYDSGRSDARSALQNAAIDVSAQAIGAAIGLKLGAIATVAASSFAFAALPLTGGAIAGALGLRMQIEKHRENKLAALLEQLDDIRFAAEQASGIVVELSREALQRSMLSFNLKGSAVSEADVKLEVVAAYLAVLDQLLVIAQPVAEALSAAEAEAERLGVNLAWA
jgi:hypothetical protein